MFLEFDSRSLPIMSRERLSFLIVFNILFCSISCKANSNQKYCKPSSCGHIKNISFPFRLKTDLNNCGHSGYELECENNDHTILYLNSKRYYVQSISYENYTIRVLDPGITKNNCSSFPFNALSFDDIPATYSYPYNLAKPNTPVTYISCPSRVKSSLYVDTASCNTKNASSNPSSSSLKEHTYVIVGDDDVIAGLEDSCKINNVAWFSSEFPIMDNTSFLSILDALANGFSLQWYSVYCGKCGGYCYLGEDNGVKCGFIDNGVKYYVSAFGVFEGFVLAPCLARFLIGLPCLIALLVYKYRRQRLSDDESIEGFLQGQNNLTPIRYKYRDIRRMTKKFRDKLGEGGYGSVFKGKLRSGIFVAIKMMNKSKASGQEFINEVATIGRIHHVNVVQLIGFCVEGSKRALVYEFMPNGSLERVERGTEFQGHISCTFLLDNHIGQNKILRSLK